MSQKELNFSKVCQKDLDFKVLLKLLFPLYFISADLCRPCMILYEILCISLLYYVLQSIFFICCFNLLFFSPINAQIPEGNLLFIISNKIQDFYRNITWAEFFQIFQVNYFPREAIDQKAKLLIKRLKCKMFLLGKFG